MVLKCWTGIYSNTGDLQSSLRFADKAQFGSNSSLCAQSCEEDTQSYSLYDKEKACVSASTAACSHRNLLADDALPDVKDVSSLYFDNFETEHFYFKSMSYRRWWGWKKASCLLFIYKQTSFFFETIKTMESTWFGCKHITDRGSWKWNYIWWKVACRVKYCKLWPAVT